jgi:hypothetical protein
MYWFKVAECFADFQGDPNSASSFRITLAIVPMGRCRDSGQQKGTKVNSQGLSQKALN